MEGEEEEGKEEEEEEQEEEEKEEEEEEKEEEESGLIQHKPDSPKLSKDVQKHLKKHFLIVFGNFVSFSCEKKKEKEKKKNQKFNCWLRKFI